MGRNPVVQPLHRAIPARWTRRNIANFASRCRFSTFHG